MSDARGFTLLEVLAAIVVLGLTLAALTSGARFGEQALRAQTREAALANHVDPVDTILRELIARAWPEGRGTGPNFAGTQRTLSFRTTMPDALTNPRTKEADVTIGVDASHRLVLTWLPWYRNWIALKPAPERIALLDGLDHVEFTYWDPTLNIPGGQWAATWNGAMAPKLLRIRLVFPKSGGPDWPDIVIATEREPWVF